MPTGYSRSPKVIKGAFVELAQPFLGPVRNVIVFQYNPESLHRTVSPWETEGSSTEVTVGKKLAQPVNPGESITLKIELDASDDLEQPELHPVAVMSGVAARLAALELLLYAKKGSSLLGAKFAGALTRPEVPLVLFVWGPGRILPVRLSSFSVEEQFFSPTLYPLQATVDVGLRVLLPDEISSESPAAAKLAVAAYNYTQRQKEILARANLANSAASAAGTLPF
jgi:hypothetical protein